MLKNIDVIMETVRKVVNPDGSGGVGLIDLQKSRKVEDTYELQLPLSAGYNILFSLLVPEPEVLDSRWKIEEGVKSEKRIWVLFCIIIIKNIHIFLKMKLI